MDSTSSDSLSNWIRRLIEGGWVEPALVQQLRIENGEAGPEDLFAGAGRPLIVAFFGGTGVGKSTLLNRLAGDRVAKTGIERPTSREITVFLHRDLPIDQLRRHLPLERLHIARHGNDNRRQVVWIDMPDVDSIEEGNRQLVLRCLPYVDVLIYVVSPERYRDDSGWQLLKQHGRRHAWLFVMNHWDQGDESQIGDFRQQLREAGFSNPILLRCDSREDLANRLPDDFGKLGEILTRLVRQGGIEQLQIHGLQQRQAERRRNVERLLQQLGRAEQVEKLKRRWRHLWQQTRDDLEPALDWPIKVLAGEIAGKGQKCLQASRDNGNPLFWDLWMRKHLTDAVDRLVLAAAESGLPSGPVRRRIDGYRDRIDALLNEQIRQSVAGAMTKPGRSFRRGLLWLTGRFRYLLPLFASGWVGWQVIARYYGGMQGSNDWLGINFAVHSLLLIGLAWLVPHLLHRLLQPSLEKVAERGVRQGIDRAFERIATDIEQLLDELQQERQQLHEQGERICARMEGPAQRSSDGLVVRLVLKKDNGITNGVS